MLHKSGRTPERDQAERLIVVIPAYDYINLEMLEQKNACNDGKMGSRKSNRYNHSDHLLGADAGGNAGPETVIKLPDKIENHEKFKLMATMWAIVLNYAPVPKETSSIFVTGTQERCHLQYLV